MSNRMDRVRRFIAEKNLGGTDFSDCDDLIENGLIDSLRFVEFVLLIAELSGRTIELDNVNIDEFRTIDAIHAAYFSGADTELVEPK